MPATVKANSDRGPTMLNPTRTATEGLQGPPALFQMLNSAQVSAVLCSGIELNVFASLADSALDIDALAAKIKCPPRTTRILADALVTTGLLARDGQKYRLTPLADAHLVPGKQMYVGDMSGILGHPVMWEGLSHLADAVRSGGTVLKEHAETPSNSFWTSFAQSSGSMSMAVSMALEAILRDWISKRQSVRVLDLAAGSGIYGYTLVKSHPNVELTALDWPNVVAESKQWAVRLGVDKKRVRYLEGSLFDLDWGGPYDLILMSQLFHHFDPRTNMALTRRVASALAPTGKVAVHDFLSDPKNPAGDMFAITMLVWTHKGQVYAEKDYRDWLMEAGFDSVHVHPNHGMPTSLIIADKK
jgi:ubiquinone/menaquinone biosynthesis C-methylase UbiE